VRYQSSATSSWYLECRDLPVELCRADLEARSTEEGKKGEVATHSGSNRDRQTAFRILACVHQICSRVFDIRSSSRRIDEEGRVRNCKAIKSGLVSSTALMESSAAERRRYPTTPKRKLGQPTIRRKNSTYHRPHLSNLPFFPFSFNSAISSATRSQQLQAS
jgi:hypothetical protein